MAKIAAVTLSLLILGLGWVRGATFDHFYVTSYRLDLVLEEPLSSVTGAVDVDIQILETTVDILLSWGTSLDPPQSDNLTVVRQGVDAVDVKGIYYNSSLALATITTATALSKGDNVKVSVRFRATVGQEQKGIFSRHFTSGGSKWTMLATSFYPSSARDLFPCVDEPSMPASFNLSLTLPTGYEVTTSLPLAGISSSDATQTVTKTYHADWSMPTYALAILISNGIRGVPYIASGRTPVTFWLPKDSTGPYVDNTLNLLYDCFCNIADTLNLNFIFTSGLSIVLVPELPLFFAGRGVIFIRNSPYYSSVYSPNSEGLYRELMVPIVYQMVRQFTEFSSPPASWADGWLPSAMTTYLHYVFLNSIGTPYAFRTDLTVVMRQSALALDTGHSKPLIDSSVTPGHPPHLVGESVMDPINSYKGASLFSMMDLSYPAGSLYDTIRILLQNNGARSISSAVFFEHFSTTVNSKASSYVSQETRRALASLPYWFNTSGYPLVSVSAVSPSAVQFNTVSFCDGCGGSWVIPVSVGSRSEPRQYVPRQDLWLDSPGGTLSAEIKVGQADWLLANTHSTGFYRAQYSGDNWIRLAQAASDAASPRRSHVLDDAFAITFAGLLDLNTSLTLVLANINGMPYQDWYPVYNGLCRLGDAFWSTDLYPAFQKFFGPLLENVNTQVENGWFSNMYDRQKVRSLMLGDMCRYNVGAARRDALSVAYDLQHAQLPTAVASSDYDALTCCAAEWGPSPAADTLWTRVTDPTGPHYQRHYNAITLGCLSNDSLPDTKLATLMDSGSDLGDSKPYVATALRYLARSRPRSLLKLMAKDPRTFQSQFGSTLMASLISSAARRLNSNQLDLVTVIAEGEVSSGVRRALAAANETVRARSYWLASHNSTLVLALQAHTLPVVSSGSKSALPVLLLTSCLMGRLAFLHC